MTAEQVLYGKLLRLIGEHPGRKCWLYARMLRRNGDLKRSDARVYAVVGHLREAGHARYSDEADGWVLTDAGEARRQASATTVLHRTPAAAYAK